MSLEDVYALKALFRRIAGARAEPAYHGALIVCQGVAVPVVFAGEALRMVFACRDWALFRALILVREHVRLKILEAPVARGVSA